MSDMETRLQTECDKWFAEVEKILGKTIDPEDEEDWAVLWFDGYTPEQAVIGMATVLTLG